MQIKIAYSKGEKKNQLTLSNWYIKVKSNKIIIICYCLDIYN